MFDFGAFQEKLHMLSRAKYLLQRLFGAFHDTPRIYRLRVTQNYVLGISPQLEEILRKQISKPEMDIWIRPFVYYVFQQGFLHI